MGNSRQNCEETPSRKGGPSEIDEAQNDAFTNTTPSSRPPSTEWKHYTLWNSVNSLIYALPNHFETDFTVRGLNATEVFSLGSAVSSVVDNQVVSILNQQRNIWDPANEYASYRFVRQAQTFPDVLLQNIDDDDDVIFGIELKAWYALSKEGEPSFRYKIDPDACAQADLLVVIPWLLSDIFSGEPIILYPFKALARYAAEIRDYDWHQKRSAEGQNSAINRPPREQLHPYPKSKEQASDSAEDDSGGNFGRVARSGFADEYFENIFEQDVLGIKLKHWLQILRAITEKASDELIERRLEALRKKLRRSNRSSGGVDEETRSLLLQMLDQIERISKKIP